MSGTLRGRYTWTIFAVESSPIVARVRAHFTSAMRMLSRPWICRKLNIRDNAARVGEFITP
jgi:hypothetical protein